MLRSVSNLRGTTYQESCQEVGLETLEERRKFTGHDSNGQNMKGIYSVNWKSFFERREEQVRTRQAGNPWNLPRKASKTKTGLHSSMERVV